MRSNSYSPVPPPVFTGENYQLWAVKMTAYLQAWDLWEAVKEDLVVPPITDNSTVQQLKIHYEKQSKLYKAKTCLSLQEKHYPTTVFHRCLMSKFLVVY